MKKVNVLDREHNITYEHVEPVLLKPGQTNAKVSIGEITNLKEKAIIGIYFMLQHKDNSIQRSFEGTPLLSRAGSACAYLNIKSNTGIQIENSPLDHYGFDPEFHLPGKYKQILSPGKTQDYDDSFDLKQSWISYDSSKIQNPDGEIVLLGFIYLDPKICLIPNTCN